MTEVLLKELSNSDIDWITATGRQTEIDAGTILIREGKAIDSLHILLEGTLAVTVSQAQNNPLARAFAAIEGGQTDYHEIARLSSGEVVGEIPFVGVRPTPTTVKALEKSSVMSIPWQQLAKKLQQDVSFASRFYRAIAILLSDRLQNLINQLGRSKIAQNQSVRDMLFILGELNDSDIDWMMATGSQLQIAANTVLIHQGGPVDALYILLSGSMAVSVAEDYRNPLARAFAALDSSETPGREIARLSKGEIIGETPFVDGRLPSATIKALENSTVLAIKRQQLAAKLQQDVGFASRFYRVIATLLSNRLQEMLSRLSYGRRVYSKGQSLDEAIKYEDELDLSVLDRMALAGTKFDWMLGRLQKS
jgi:bacteriocin-type transport-associated protein